MRHLSLINGLIVLSLMTAVACKKTDEEAAAEYSVDTVSEVGQQVGEVTASIDESGGSGSGAFAMDMQSAQKSFARFTGEPGKSKLGIFPQANAAVCSTAAFGACGATIANSKVRTFESCSFGVNATATGSVTLTWAGTNAATCQFDSASGAVQRVPDFMITNARGATFTIQPESGAGGQTLTRTGATSFTFSNPGVRRVFTSAAGVVKLDITSETGTDLAITGTSRASRTVTGGSIIVTNNLSAVSCTLIPNSVTWTSGCSCPTSGSWSGTCSDSSSYQLDYTSTCGAATITTSDGTKSVNLDRCI